jgi:glycine cleavage system T protein (aminomethyltransferase)
MRGTTLEHESGQARSTPLAGVAEADSPTWVEFCRWRMPVQFEGIVAEHLAVRRKAGLFDISHMGRLTLDGAGADEAVEQLVTRGTTDMAPGTLRYSFICNAGGDILDDLMVGRLEHGWQWIVNAANRQRVVAQINAAGFGDLVTDRTFETAMLALQGPRSPVVLDAVWPEARTADRKRYRIWHADRGGARLTGSRSGYTGEDGFEIYGPPEAVAELWTDLRAAGAAPCGLGSRDSLRNEAALPLYGHELVEDTSPWELGLAYAVTPGKSFIGDKGLLARHVEPPVKRRVGLVLAGRRIARETMPVLAGDRQVGEVTSGTWSPLREQPIAQAYLETDVAREGASVEIDVRGRRETARVVAISALLPRS